MLVRRPKFWSWQLRRLLAAWFAVVLAAAPFLHSSLPAETMAGPAAIVDLLVAQNGADGGALMLGVPGRASSLEATLALVARASALRPAIGVPLPAPRVAIAAVGDERPLFQRSAVGTARTPTGPPA